MHTKFGDKLYKNKFFQNISWTFSAKIVAMLFFMGSDIFLARLLGVDGYAEWTFFYAIATMLFYLTWLGINASTKVFVSRQNIPEKGREYIRAGIFLRIIVSAASFVLIFTLAGFAAGRLGYPDKYPHLIFLLRCGSFIVFMNSFAEFYKEVNIGLQRYRNVFLITLAEFGFNFLLGLAGAYLSGSAVGVSVGYALSGSMVLALGLILLKTELHGGSLLQVRKKLPYMGEIFRYALPLAVINIAGMILVEMDTFMLGALSTKGEVATYSIAKQLCAKASHINYALATGSLTSFSIINAGNYIEKKKKFQKMCGINVAITLVVGLTLLIAGPFAIRVLYGVEYRHSGNILRWLVPYYILYAISNYYSLFLDFQKKARVRSICYCSAMMINMLLNWMLIPKHGAVGASVATSLSLIPYTFFVIAATDRFFKEKRHGEKENDLSDYAE